MKCAQFFFFFFSNTKDKRKLTFVCVIFLLWLLPILFRLILRSPLLLLLCIDISPSRKKKIIKICKPETRERERLPPFFGLPILKMTSIFSFLSCLEKKKKIEWTSLPHTACIPHKMQKALGIVCV